MGPVRVGVVGAGAFGVNHLRVLSGLESVVLSGVMDIDPERAADAAARYNCLPFPGLDDLIRESQAAIVAVPTVHHADVGCRLLDAGLDVLVEKPIAADPESARRLIESAERSGRILQVGHLERFNPAVRKLEEIVSLPLFFEIHRMSV